MKGQTEIIGLVVVVILLILGGLIYLRLQTNPPQDYSELRTNVRATHILQALTLITIEGKQLKDHLVDCHQEKRCDVLKKEIPAILQAALPQNQAYQFVALQGEKELLRLGTCSTGIASSFPLTRQGLVFDLQLKLCTKS